MSKNLYLFAVLEVKILFLFIYQVWCSDITYIPVKNGFLYLVVIMEWATRKLLTWRLSNTLNSRFCVEALEEAIS
jgi:putative transposase